MIKIMPERKLMRTIGKGHEVPWPETLVDGDFVFPKDYRMNDFPTTLDGMMWYDIPDVAYIDWLADYLPNNLPELSNEQQHLYNNLDKYDRISGFWIGDRAGWHESTAASVPNYIFPTDFHHSGDLSKVTGADGGYTYKDYDECNRDTLEPGERLMTPEELILDEFGWQLVLEREEQQFTKFWPDFIKLDSIDVVFSTSTIHHEPPDAGWRVYLSMVLHRIPGKTAKIKELEDFFHYYLDMLSK